MYPHQQFPLTRQALLLAIIASAYPVAGYSATAGRVDFSVGQVVAVAADGRQRPLQKGSEVSAGDAINTAAGARAQIRFTDGGYVSLQPNTQFRVDEYQYEGKTDGQEKGFFSLLRGGLRTITGAVGRVNRDNYKVATPAATIGIRGTGYNAMLAEGLSISVTDGIISLTNKGGSLIITQGQSAYVADMNTAPVLTFEKPSTPPASLSDATVPVLKDDKYIGGDDIIVGGLTVLTGVMTVSSGTVVDGAGGATSVVSDYPGILTFDQLGNRVFYVQGQNPAGGLTDFTGATLDVGISGTDSYTGNSLAASGYDGVVAWGRFYGTLKYSDPTGTWTTTLGPNQGIHSVVGIPTAVMPNIGSAHYDLTGATRPTLASGAVAPGTVSGGGLDVYFDTSNFNGSLNLSIGDSTSYSFNLSFSGTLTGNSFTPTSSAWSSNSGCSSSCSASVSGFFAGANAERAGVAYGIDGSVLGSTIRGAAVYTKTANPAPAM